MNKLICFIVGITLALISFSASADTFTFVGHSFRAYSTTSSGMPIGDAKTIYENYKIVIDTDRDIIHVDMGNNSYTFYVRSHETFADTYRGIYFYCMGNLTVNIYSDRDGDRHIIIRTEETASVFDI